MVKKTTIGVLIGFMILAAAGAIVYARGESFVPGLMLDGMKTRMIENLKLTNDQVERIEVIFEEIKDEFPDMHKHHQEIHEELSRQFAGNTFDQEAVKAMREKKLTELRSTTDLLIVKLADLHEILTPEQREKLVQHINEIRENHGDGFGPGSGHGHFPGR